MSTSKAFDKTREKRLIAAAKKINCKSIDLFEADFGHWPPKDLTISNPPTGDVKFRPSTLTMIASPKHWPGLFSLKNIAMFYLLTNSLVKALVITALSKASSTMGFVDRTKKDRTIHLNEALALYGYFNTKSEYLANVISHEHFHIMQRDDEHVSLTCAFDDRTKIRTKLKSHNPHILYLAGEAEMQARLHTIIANIYQQHGQLPLTPLELIAALKSHDVEIPDDIEDRIFMASGQQALAYAKALKKFPRSEEFVENNSDQAAVRGINKVVSRLEEEHQLKFWTRAIPRLYGDLLEIYGDAYGSERMGFGHNIQLREIFYREMKNLCAPNDPEDPQKHLTRAYKAVAAMPKRQRDELERLVANNVLYQTPYDTEAILIPSRYTPEVLRLFTYHSDQPHGIGIKPYEEPGLWNRIKDEMDETNDMRAELV